MSADLECLNVGGVEPRGAEAVKKAFVADRKAGRLVVVKLADFDPADTQE